MDENKLWKLRGFIVLLIYRSHSEDNHILYEYIPSTFFFLNSKVLYTLDTLAERKKYVLYTLVKYSKAAVHFIC